MPSSLSSPSVLAALLILRHPEGLVTAACPMVEPWQTGVSTGNILLVGLAGTSLSILYILLLLLASGVQQSAAR